MTSGAKTITSGVSLSEIRDSFLVLAGAILLPVLFHLIPENSLIPGGARFLPLFYAPFIGIVLFRPRTAIIGGALAPILNHVITSRPELAMVKMLTVDVILFTLIASFGYHYFKRFWALAPISYIAAKFLSSLALIPPSYLGQVEPGLSAFEKAISVSVPGLAMLLIINWMLLKIKERAE